MTARRFLFALLVGTLAALAVIAFELGPALGVAAVLSALLSPLQKRLTKLLRKRANIAAGLLTTAVMLVVMVPTVWLSAVMAKEMTDGIRFVAQTLQSDGVKGLVKKLPGPSRKLADDALALLPGKKLPEVDSQTVTENSAQAVGTVLKTTGAFLFQMLMMLIALYFMLSQGRQFLDWMDASSPLRPGQVHELVAEFKKVSRSIVVSTFATAGAQAVVGLIGYLIARVPNPLFFTAVTFLMAVVPSVGGGVVCLLAAGLLLLTGHPYFALFLAIWAVVVVGLVDNLVQPLVMRGQVQLNGGIVFFALVGGLVAFGGVGLLIGPFAVALFLALLRIYWRDFAQKPSPRAAAGA